MCWRTDKKSYSKKFSSAGNKKFSDALMNGEIENKDWPLFEPFCRYLSNNLGSASVFNVKISSFCLELKWTQVANSGNFHRSFKNRMARSSSNFGNMLQMMVGIGNE